MNFSAGHRRRIALEEDGLARASLLVKDDRAFASSEYWPEGHSRSWRLWRSVFSL
jgi:hypothetical protein